MAITISAPTPQNPEPMSGAALAPVDRIVRAVSRNVPVPPRVLSVDDIQKLYVILSDKTADSARRQLDIVVAGTNISSTEVEKRKADLVAIAPLCLWVQSPSGELLKITNAEDITANVLPDKISLIEFDSAIDFRLQVNTEPWNRFTLTLDFSEPPSFQQYNPWTQPTPNKSGLFIWSASSDWAAGVGKSVTDFLAHRRRWWLWIHTPNAYNVSSWVIGMPAAFWIVYRFESTFAATLDALPSVLRSALLIYGFLLALTLFRLSVYGLRWLFPLVEMKDSRIGPVRAFVLGPIVAGAVALVVDVALAIGRWLSAR